MRRNRERGDRGATDRRPVHDGGFYRRRSGHDLLDLWDGRTAGMGQRGQRNGLCSLVFSYDNLSLIYLIRYRQAPNETAVEGHVTPSVFST